MSKKITQEGVDFAGRRAIENIEDVLGFGADVFLIIVPKGMNCEKLTVRTNCHDNEFTVYMLEKAAESWKKRGGAETPNGPIPEPETKEGGE